MGNAKMDLEKYITGNFNQHALLKALKSYGLALVMADTIKELDLNEYNSVIKRMRAQKLLNPIFKREISLLSRSFNDNNIKLVILKGLPLAVDLYDPIEARESKDIDVLVDVDDVNASLDLLNTLGYLCSDKLTPVSHDLTGSELNTVLYGMIHFPEFHKHVLYGLLEYTLHMDFHISLFHYQKDKRQATKAVVNRAVKETLFGESIWILELHDRIIHLLTHFTKECIKNDYFFMLTGLRNYGVVYPRLKLLHEIALLIDKYMKQIDWKLIYERALNLNKCADVLFPVQLINKIYPQRSPQWFSAELKTHLAADDYGLMAQLLLIITDMEPDKLILTHPYILLEELLHKLNYIGSELKCRHFSNPGKEGCSGCFAIEKAASNQIDIYQSHFKTGSFPAESPDNYATGEISWDEINFYIKLDVNDNKLAGAKVLPSLSLYLSDYKFNKNFNCFIPRLIFRPEVGIGNNKLQVEFNNNLHDFDYQYKLDTTGKGYNLFLAIPWSYLGLEPIKGMKFLFDVEMDIHDLDGNRVRTHKSWVAGYSPVLFGTIELIQ